jgi:hypothetical protein
MHYFFKMTLVKSGMAYHDFQIGKRARNVQVHFTIFD